MSNHYTWHGFEPEPEMTGDGSGDPDKHFITIAHDGEEVCVIVHRTVGGTYPINGALARQKEFVAQHITKVLNENPIDWDAILDKIDFENLGSGRD